MGIHGTETGIRALVGTQRLELVEEFRYLGSFEHKSAGMPYQGGRNECIILSFQAYFKIANSKKELA